MEAYVQRFYSARHQKTLHSADTILTLLLERIIPVLHSAVDVGCGVGTWLSVLRAKGVKDIQGIDGAWVDPDLLVIPGSRFERRDLSAPLVWPRVYDLAISLEVAEHLPAHRAADFVVALTRLSDFVLFSAAIPFQGGLNHLNERWQRYWIDLFGAVEYVAHDFLRPNIWNDDKIPYWYRQNILFFSKRDRVSDIRHDAGDLARWSSVWNVVHPDLYLNKACHQPGVKSSFRLFRRSLTAYMKKRLGMTARGLR